MGLIISVHGENDQISVSFVVVSATGVFPCAFSPSQTSCTHSWADFQHQNELVLEELAKSGVPHQVIDAYYLNIRRPDEHLDGPRDCLHSCYPSSKLDVYSRLMLHYLRMDRAVQDVVDLLLKRSRNGWLLNVTTEYQEEAWKEAARTYKQDYGRAAHIEY